MENMNKRLTFLCIGIFLFCMIGNKALPLEYLGAGEGKRTLIVEDLDPLIDLEITFEIIAIRVLDIIDDVSDPDFFVKVFINNKEFISPIWNDTSYLYNCWSITNNVPDELEIVNITIQLWDWNHDENNLCDISGKANYNDNGYDVHLVYNLRTGNWNGDDYIGDPSGFGRVCG